MADAAVLVEEGDEGVLHRGLEQGEADPDQHDSQADCGARQEESDASFRPGSSHGAGPIVECASKSQQ